MKKVIILFLTVLLLSGCVNIKDSSIESIVSSMSSANLKLYNTYRSGYKYYLPAGLYVTKSKNYNELIKNKYETFYMYIDLIGYLNKKPSQYEENGDTFYYGDITNGDSFGYIVIKNTQDGKYLVEIAYNYAKIEVIVEKARLNVAVANSIIMLSSIEYNDSFLQSISEESLLSYREETVDIFKKEEATDSNKLLQYVEEYDESDEYEIPDYDVVK